LKRKLIPIIFIFVIFFFILNEMFVFFKKREVNLEFTVKKGETVESVIERLREKGAFSRSLFTDIFVRVKDVKFKAGKYKVAGKYSDRDIIDVLEEGQLRFVKVTIPEGYNLFDIAELLDEKKICNEKEFLNLTLNETFTKSLGVNSKTLEGFLFPDTYYFADSDNCESVVKTMYGNFKKRVIPLFKSYTPPELVKKALGNVTVEKIVAVASIVEKESGLKEERPKIAGVIYRRLIKKMPLQCDPTVIYGYRLKGKKIEDLKGSDIRKSQSLYNTYLYKDLPPTPICNPGLDSIVAAMFPEKSSYLYFFAVNGRHVFSKSYKEHLRKLKKYYNRRVK